MEFYSTKEFADLIGVHENTLRRWDKTGKLTPHHRTIGGHRVYSQEQVDNYFKVFNKEGNS
jgi:excisionase family DNA binding protein